MKRLMSIVVTALAVTFVRAEGDPPPNTWYVDAANYGKSGLDGSSENPYGSIQEAIDAEATLAGDTILVRPGTYDRGVCTKEDGYGGGLKHPCRVFVTKDRLAIKSTDGRDVTHVVGEVDPTGTDGRMGPASVACVFVANTVSALVFDGFTLRDGTVENTDNKSTDSGGGISCVDIKTANQDGIHVFGCVISNCMSRGGVVHSLTLHRSLVAHCRTPVAAVGNVVNYSKAENSVILGSYGHGTGYSTLVNCLVTGTAGGKAGNYTHAVCNSVFSMNGSDRDNAGTSGYCAFTNSVAGNCDSTAAKFDPARCDNSAYAVPATNLFFAPVFRDFRLIEGSEAIGRGDPAILASTIVLPEGYVFRDFNGVPIDMDAGRINAGPVQEVVSGPLGLANFSSLYYGLSQSAVNGFSFYHDNVTFAYVKDPPRSQWCVTSANGDHILSCVLHGSGGGRFHCADLGGRAYVLPPQPGETASYEIQTCAKNACLYLDPNGNDAWDGSCDLAHADAASGKGPWRTFAHTGTNDVTKQTNRRTIVWCAPGTYAEGQYGSRRMLVANATYRKLHYRASGAVSETILKGVRDPETQGRGANAVAFAECQASGGAFFTGFTFTDCCTKDDTVWAGYVGAVLFGNGAPVVVTDSVITNCDGRSGILYGDMTADRCLIAGNRSNHLVAGGGSCVLRGCVIRDNVVPANDYCAWVYSARVGNCTFYQAPSAVAGDFSTQSSAYIYNSILINMTRMKLAGAVRGCLLEGCSGAQTGFSDNRTGKAWLANLEANDMRLTAASDVAGLEVADFDGFAGLVNTDYDGNPVFVDGKIRAVGACTTTVPNSLVVADTSNAFARTGDVPAGRNYILPGESLTLAPNVSSLRPVVGWIEGGVTNVFGATASKTWTAEEVLALPNGLVVEPVFGTEWFANPNADPAAGVVGDDANHGFSRFYPKKTLAAALERAAWGDTVWAAPGTYAEKTLNTLGYSTPARAEVPKGVTLRSESDNPADTVIMGAAGDGEYGSGADAVRCVVLCTNATVRGFTCTGGRMKNLTTDTGPDSCAPGISSYTWEDRRTAFAENCIISNCVAQRFIVMSTVLTSCRLLENRTVDRGIAYGCPMRNCLIVRNRLASDQQACMYGYFENITFLDNVADQTGAAFGNALTYATPVTASHIANSILDTKCDGHPVTNCVFVGNMVVRRDVFVNPRYLSRDAIRIGDDYVPQADSPLVDTGDNGGVRDAQDLAGVSRVMNGTVDVGAFEYDWRPTYATDIRRTLVDVVSVTPSVYETDRKSVALGKPGEGGALAVERRPEAFEGVDAVYRFLVTGNGVLTVRSGDAVLGAFVAAAEPQKLKVAAGVTGLTFAYEPGAGDTGTAELLRASLDRGLLVIVQ